MSVKREKHSGHEKHLCKMIVGDQEDMENIKKLVNKPQYLCYSCGRTANKEENLCHPSKLYEGAFI